MRYAKLSSLTLAVLIGTFVLITYSHAETTYIPKEGDLLKSPKHTSVYLYESGKRRPFVNSAIYHSWYTDFSSVKEITVEQMEEIKLGPPMPIRWLSPNKDVLLLKFPLNPRVYAVTASESDTGTYAGIQHIPNEETARVLFGDDWGQKIVELPELYYLFYKEGAGLYFSPQRPDWLNQKLVMDMAGFDKNTQQFFTAEPEECTHDTTTYYAIYAAKQEHNPFLMTLYNNDGKFLCQHDDFEGSSESCLNDSDIAKIVDEWTCTDV